MTYSKQSYIYKTVEGCQLHADVYRAEGNDRRPGILWIHGGGLVLGNRRMIPVEQIERYIKAGYTVISLDYRLAPETKIQEIVEDVQDAYSWVYREGPDLFGIVPDRLALIGHSAGGYLALVAGFCVSPIPRALISFYGYGDIMGECYSRPSPHYIKEPMVSPKIAYEGVGDSMISESEFAGFTDKRWLFYLYCRQQGLWTKEITGHDPQEADEVFDPFCPVRNITKAYPPTLLLHGELDTDVPCELSNQMAKVLEQKNVSNRLIILEKFGHMFDIVPDTSLEGSPSGLNHPKVVEIFDVIQIFLREHMRQ